MKQPIANIVDLSTRKFDPYDGMQETVIFNDLRKDTIGWQYLLNILDRYAMDVKCLYKSVPWNPTNIVITCPRLPVDEFQEENRRTKVLGPYEDVYQIERRIHVMLQWHPEAREWRVMNCERRYPGLDPVEAAEHLMQEVRDHMESPNYQVIEPEVQ